MDFIKDDGGQLSFDFIKLKLFTYEDEDILLYPKEEDYLSRYNTEDAQTAGAVETIETVEVFRVNNTYFEESVNGL